jgi:hypothetical protein
MPSGPFAELRDSREEADAPGNSRALRRWDHR